jgi:hypothetical protein
MANAKPLRFLQNYLSCHTGVPLPCHEFSCPRCSSSSSANGKRRRDLNAVFAKSHVYRMAIGLNELLVTAFLGLHQ